MGTTTWILLGIVVLAILGIGVADFVTGVFTGADKVRDALPGLENITAQVPISLPQQTKSTLCQGDARCETGTVTKIVDGDTLDMGDTRIRLALINTPERGDEGYSEAKAALAELCPVGGSIIFDEDDGQQEGSYDRAIGKVFCGGSIGSANQQLVKGGYAEVVVDYCDESEFARESWAAIYCD